jgi:hypothetical protein
MGNSKSKPTGTIHVRTTPGSIQTPANVANAADSTMLVLETGRTGSDQDTTAVAADANPNAIAADDTTGTSASEDAPSKSTSDTALLPSPVETVPGTSAANTPPASLTVTTGPVPAVADTKTKMEIATEIFKRLKKVKGTTRKEIIDHFVADAKLSKAGASTYYQLIKAKVDKE